MRRRAILLLAVMGAALVLSSTVALAVTRQCQTGVDCYGTKKSDTLLGTDGDNVMYGKGRGDTLKGFGEGDLLYGQGGRDKLFGGPGDDHLWPGPGNDVSDGGENEDTYYIEGDNWGKDTINEPDTFNRVRFDFMSTALTINLTSNSLQPEVKNAAGTSTINWSNSVIVTVSSRASGDDTITGNAAANTILSSNGFDTVYGGEGSDVIDVDDGAGSDWVDCGPGNDTVAYEGSTDVSLGDTVTNCEVLHPS